MWRVLTLALALFVVSVAEIKPAWSQGDRLYDVCPPQNKGPAVICATYIERHFPQHFDTINRILDGLDGRKDQARDWARADQDWLIGTQWTLVILGALATVMISLNQLGGLDLRRWAIIPSVAVSSVSALVAFYSFGQSNKDNIEAQTQYALALEQFQFELISAVEARDLNRIDEEFIGKFQAALSNAVKDRKNAFLKLTAERAEEQKKQGKK